MSDRNTPEFDDLLSRYLDAGLDEREEAALRRCLSEADLAARFLEMTRLNAEIAGLSAAPVPDDIMVGLVMRDLRGEPDAFPRPAIHVADVPSAMGHDVIPRSPKWWFATWALGMAACIGLLAATAFHFTAPVGNVSTTIKNDDPVASVAVVYGTVNFSRSSPITNVLLLTGKNELSGDGVLQAIGPGETAVLSLPDGTQLELPADTTVRLQLQQPDRRIALEKGSFRARLPKQKGSQPLIFATPNAEATGEGAEFTMIWENPNSMVIVTEGAVAVQRSEDGFDVLVKAGSYTHVENHGDFRTWPIGLLPKKFQDMARQPK